jgi:hypothetical protein
VRLFPQQGSLFYVARGPAGGRTLWRLDLATGHAAPQREIPRATELVDASSVGAGLVGLTAVAPRGTERALLFDEREPDARPVVLGQGALVAWGPEGRSVAVARMGPRRGGCGRAVRISVVTTETGVREPILDDPALCGALLSLGRDGAETYFTQRTRHGFRIRSCGTTCVPAPMLTGFSMVSVSPLSDFLVTPTGSLVTGEVVSSGIRPVIVPGTALGPGTVLYWRGRGGPIPLGDDANALLVDRALAWSPDGAHVVVAGRLGASRGVFLIDAGPGPASVRRAPTYVVRTGGPSWATFSDDGIAFLAMGGRLVAFGEGSLAEIPLPTGAAEPAGPITWTP